MERHRARKLLSCERMNEQQANRIVHFHRLVGMSAVVCATAHLVAIVWTRQGIKPYSNLGWLPEQLLIGCAILVPGLATVISVPFLKRRAFLVPFVGAGAIAFSSFAEFLRYFTPMTALFSIVPLIDAVLIARLVPRRWLGRGLAVVFGVALAGVSAFLFASYTGAGQ